MACYQGVVMVHAWQVLRKWKRGLLGMSPLHKIDLQIVVSARLSHSCKQLRALFGLKICDESFSGAKNRGIVPYQAALGAYCSQKISQSFHCSTRVCWVHAVWVESWKFNTWIYGGFRWSVLRLGGDISLRTCRSSTRYGCLTSICAPAASVFSPLLQWVLLSF